MYGKEKPKETKKKMKKIITLDAINEKPIAVPKKGALHGVANRVANAPDKKCPKNEELLNFLVILFVKNCGDSISKKPKRFNEKNNIIVEISIKKYSF